MTHVEAGTVPARGHVWPEADTRAVEEHLAAQTRILEMIAGDQPLHETLRGLADLVEGQVEGGRCSILLTSDGCPAVGHGLTPRSTALSAGAELSTSFWSVPILASGTDDILGTLTLWVDRPGGPGPIERSLLEQWSHLAQIAVERDRTRAQLAHQALHDPLTGLPNRALFLDRLTVALDRSARRHTDVVVLFLDVDRFKIVNDSLGHEAGDRLLVALADRLRNALRPGDTLARFGGDEFTILCDDVDGLDGAAAIARRVSELAAAPFSVGDQEVFLTVSIGIAHADSSTGGPEGLLRDADVAMFRAKERGRARHEVFDEAMRVRALDRLRTENALRRALDRGELRLHYQPEVRLRDGRTFALEALLRWEHPDRGLLLPRDFLAFAEETALIVPIGEWVLEEACRQAAAWQGLDGGDAGPVVWVNLSPRQLADPGLVIAVERALSRAGLAPDRLCLEITESALVDDAESALAMLWALKSLGVRLAVDDFGTGYSSLSYLSRFPVDALKVDQSFVHGVADGPDDSAIVAAVVGLGRALGLAVIAEGVETPEQLERLRALGCEMAQGYWFAMPQPAAAIETLLRAGGLVRMPPATD